MNSLTLSSSWVTIIFGRWAQSENLLKWLNKVVEEALYVSTLQAAPDVEVRALATCFRKYQELLDENNSLDFSGIQYEALQLLEKHADALDQMRAKFSYVMVDEYQDTNTIQERILLLLAGERRNLCEVCDDDQGLYRLRGATIRNVIKSDERAKSFHLDTYCFDSGSESQLFWDLLREDRVKKIYFTEMLTHGQTDLFVQYIDPSSHTVRSHYPDFIFQREETDGTLKYVIVEVKADSQIEDAVVQAKKDIAEQLAVASGMEYRILPSSESDKRHYRVLP